MIIPSEPWPFEAEASPSMCLIQSTTAFPSCDGTTPNPILCHNKPLSTCNVALLLFGEEKGEKGAAPLTPLTLQSRCEEGKMRVLIGLQVHGILQTQQKSQVSLLVPSLRITRLNLASLVLGCTIQHSTTLKWLKMVSNLAHPQLQSCKYSQCPHPMLPACWCHLLRLLNCPQGKLGCISCTGPAV